MFLWYIYTQAFLKKEFGHENIYFWSACEDYRQLTSVKERKLAAKEIVSLHISSKGLYTITIDNDERQSIFNDLDLALPDLFEKSQEHIYKLMKFDSFLRFQKSDFYKKSFMAELDGQPLPMNTSPLVRKRKTF